MGRWASRSETENGQITWAGLHGEQGERVRNQERAGDMGWDARGAGRAGQRPRADRRYELGRTGSRTSSAQTETWQETWTGQHEKQGEQVRDRERAGNVIWAARGPG